MHENIDESFANVNNFVVFFSISYDGLQILIFIIPQEYGDGLQQGAPRASYFMILHNTRIPLP
jgi:hypothetical protein